jgi:hypothetical protein
VAQGCSGREPHLLSIHPPAHLPHSGALHWNLHVHRDCMQNSAPHCRQSRPCTTTPVTSFAEYLGDPLGGSAGPLRGLCGGSAGSAGALRRLCGSANEVTGVVLHPCHNDTSTPLVHNDTSTPPVHNDTSTPLVRPRSRAACAIQRWLSRMTT